MTTSPRRRAIPALAVPLALIAALVVAAPAFATAPAGYDESAPPAADPNPPGSATEATIVDMVDTSGLFGGTVPAAVAQTPYPSSGLQNQRSVTTAQIILDDPSTPTGERIPTYCIDLDTETTIGIHYELGDWTEANVPNLEYVQWILENFYPTVPTAPAGTAAEKVRAVQGAIWYFTDQFVVAPAYTSQRAAVRQIVEAAQAALAGPVPPAPDLPTLTVTPASLDGFTAGELVGPYAVGGTVASAVISIPAGTSVFRDSAGTDPVADGESVVPGDALWIEYDPAQEDQGFTLQASVAVPAGNVFLYDGNNPPRTTAQKLVLAAETPVTIQAAASVTPEPAGTLQVQAVIAGPAAGTQGPITLQADCVQSAASWERTYVFEVPAGRTAPAEFFQTDIPEDAECTLTQTADGSTPTTVLTGSALSPVTGTVTIIGGGTATVAITDTYDLAPGSVRAVVVVTGNAAGAQGAIGVRIDCVDGGSTTSGVYTLPPGVVGTQLAGTLTGVPEGSTCTLTQTADGAGPDAFLTASSVTPSSATVPAGGSVTLTLSDTFSAPGALQVDVALSGTAAGEQGAIELLIECTASGEPPTSQTVDVPAGTPAGTRNVASVSGLAPGAECSVEQTESGANADAVLDSSTISPDPATIESGGLSVATVANVYSPQPGPTPTPTPTPTVSPLPPTGGTPPTAWILGGVGALVIGAALAAIPLLRRRRA